MVGRLLLRGMLAGLLAGLLAFAFLKAVGEPPVERAIAFEARMDAAREAHEAHGMAVPAEAPELVSRPVQAGWGLLTGVAVYGTALGGLFALAFALAHGRAGRLGPRASAALLALAGFTAVALVPGLKYPANPPAVGDPGTIGLRTALFFGMIALSLAALVAAGKLRLALLGRLGGWNAALAAGGFYVAAVALAGALLPAVDEVPEGFPAGVLWQVRLAALGAQALIFAGLGLGFGALAERLLEPPAAFARRGIGA